MNVLGAIMAIRLQVTGSGQVTSVLNGVRSSIANAGNAAKSTAIEVQALGAALTVSGLALAKTSMSAYEDLEKTRRSFVAFLGETKGNEIADWLSNFATEANAPTEALRDIAKSWIGLGGSADLIKPLITGMENLNAATGGTGAALERAGRVIAKIQGNGKFGAVDRNQLVRAGVPVNLIAKELGVDNINQAIGKSADEVVPAIIRALNKLPKQTPLLFQQIANQVEHLQKALAPTGRLFEIALTPLVVLGGAALSVFEFINKWTFGLAGAVATIGLLVTGVVMLTEAMKGLAIVQAVVNALQYPYATFVPILMNIAKAYNVITSALKIQVVWQAIAAALSGPKGWAALAVAGTIAAAAGVAWAYGAFGGSSDEPSGSAKPAERPVRRSDQENWMSRSRAKAYA